VNSFGHDAFWALEHSNENDTRKSRHKRAVGDTLGQSVFIMERLGSTTRSDGSFDHGDSYTHVVSLDMTAVKSDDSADVVMRVFGYRPEYSK